jgi:P-type E1-E2 ATPase
MMLTVVAISVSAIPESLPLIVTLVLASGVWRMSERKVLVKRLQAVEALGQAKVIAVDKTGTITKNQMTVGEIYTNNRYIKVSGDGYVNSGEFIEGENKLKISHEMDSKTLTGF